jgi:hypothetical protein
MGRIERKSLKVRQACSQASLPLLIPLAYPTNHSVPSVHPSAMATATLLSSSFAMPAAARRASSPSSASLSFAKSQLAGLSLSAGVATPTAVALLPKRQQLQPIVARKSSICLCFLRARIQLSWLLRSYLNLQLVSAVPFFFSASASN